MKYLSASKLNLYSDCSLKYKFQYVDKLGSPPKSIHLAYGSAVHKGLETLNLSLLKEKADIEDIFQSYHDEYEKEVKGMKIEKDFLMKKLYFHGLNTLQRYYDNMIDYEVIGAEQRFNVPIIYPNGEECRYPLFGIIDVIMKRKDQLMIVDYKTSKEAYTGFKLDTSVQLTLYSYAFRHLLKNGEIKGIRKKKEDYIGYYVLLKDYETLDGDIKMQRRKIDDIQYERMFYIIKNSLKGIDEGIFLPNYNSQCQWCEFKKNCLAFTG